MGKQDKKLLKNIEENGKKEKTKQQKSKIHGQKQVKQGGKHNKKVRMYNS